MTPVDARAFAAAVGADEPTDRSADGDDIDVDPEIEPID
jgi:hypothetical protein